MNTHETTSTPPQPNEPDKQKPPYGLIVRDVVGISVLSIGGGFLLGGLAGSLGMVGAAAFALSAMALGMIGFSISGCLASGSRWRHIWRVGIGIWVVGVVGLFFIGRLCNMFFMWIIAVGWMMLFGGLLSEKIKGSSKNST